jgi:hypothetical protein
VVVGCVGVSGEILRRQDVEVDEPVRRQRKKCVRVRREGCLTPKPRANVMNILSQKCAILAQNKVLHSICTQNIIGALLF